MAKILFRNVSCICGGNSLFNQIFLGCIIWKLVDSSVYGQKFKKETKLLEALFSVISSFLQSVSVVG